MVLVNWCCGNYRGYSWKLNRIMLTRIVTRKERKYSLMRPFWFVIIVDIFICASEVVFGKMFSSQIKSRREDADFWLIVRFI